MIMGTDERPHATAGIWLAIFALLLHLPAIWNSFAYDDFDVIVENPQIRRVENVWGLFGSRYFHISRELSYRPLVTLSYFLDHALWGLDARGFNLTDKLLHAANVTLGYWLITRLVGNNRLGVIAAILFAAHPVGTEALNVSAFREDPLALLFLLMASIAYLNLRERAAKERAAWGVAMGLLLQCALFSKELGLVFPALMLLLDWNLATRERDRISAEGWIFRFLCGVALLGPYLVVRFWLLKRPLEARLPFIGGSFSAALLLQPRLWIHNLRLLFLPISLAADYEPVARWSFSPFSFLWAGVALACLGAILLRAAFHLRGVGVGAGWMVLLLLPVSNVIPIANPVAERYLYGPSLGASLLMAAAIGGVELFPGLSRSDWRKFWRIGLGVVIGLTFASLTIARNRTWGTERRIYLDTVRKTPISQRFHVNLGQAYLWMGEGALAEAEFRRSLTLEPAPAESFRAREYRAGGYFCLGNALGMQGRHSEAAEAFRRCLALDPRHAEAHHQLGATYVRLGLYERALQHLEEAVRLAPHHAQAQQNLRAVREFLQRRQQ